MSTIFCMTFSALFACLAFFSCCEAVLPQLSLWQMVRVILRSQDYSVVLAVLHSMVQALLRSSEEAALQLQVLTALVDQPAQI